MSNNSDPTARAATATAMAWATAAKHAVTRVAGSRWARCYRNGLIGGCPWWGGFVLRQRALVAGEGKVWAMVGGLGGAWLGRGERLLSADSVEKVPSRFLPKKER